MTQEEKILDSVFAEKYPFLKPLHNYEREAVLDCIKKALTINALSNSPIPDIDFESLKPKPKNKPYVDLSFWNSLSDEIKDMINNGLYEVKVKDGIFTIQDRSYYPCSEKSDGRFPVDIEKPTLSHENIKGWLIGYLLEGDNSDMEYLKKIKKQSDDIYSFLNHYNLLR